VLPTSLGWIVICLALGAAFTTMAILGFAKLSRFAEVASPWIFFIFIAGALAALPRLGVSPGFGNFRQVATTKIWNSVAAAVQEKMGFWHVLFFAQFCNLAMHVGLSDMALFRYAKKWTYGLFTSFGVFPGHMLAWVASGIEQYQAEKKRWTFENESEGAGFSKRFRGSATCDWRSPYSQRKILTVTARATAIKTRRSAASPANRDHSWPNQSPFSMRTT
jgi:hypothetical protein